MGALQIFSSFFGIKNYISKLRGVMSNITQNAQDNIEGLREGFDSLGSTLTDRYVIQ